MEIKLPLVDFEKIRILPNTPVEINSRAECDTRTNITGIELDVPLMCPPMHYLYTAALAENLEKAGSLAVIPRNCEMIHVGKRVVLNTSLEKALESAKLLFALETQPVLSIEIANGHMKRLGDKIKEVKDKYPTMKIWAGTVCTAEGVEYLGKCGADAVLIGIGIGSVCTTTKETGVGLPAFATTLICSQTGYPIILTGGIREYGDINKAILAGANGVYIGRLLRGCIDTFSKTIAWGEASEKQKKSKKHIEGKIEPIEMSNKTSSDIIREAKEHLQSAMSYVNAKTIEEFKERGRFVVLD